MLDSVAYEHTALHARCCVKISVAIERACENKLYASCVTRSSCIDGLGD